MTETRRLQQRRLVCTLRFERILPASDEQAEGQR